MCCSSCLFRKMCNISEDGKISEREDHYMLKPFDFFLLCNIARSHWALDRWYSLIQVYQAQAMCTSFATTVLDSTNKCKWWCQYNNGRYGSDFGVLNWESYKWMRHTEWVRGVVKVITYIILVTKSCFLSSHIVLRNQSKSFLRSCY